LSGELRNHQRIHRRSKVNPCSALVYRDLRYYDVKERKQLSNHLEEDIQLLINFESNLKFDSRLVEKWNNSTLIDFSKNY
jgi:hypothetical protein